MNPIQNWLERRRFRSMSKGDARFVRDSLDAIAAVDPTLATTIRQRLMARLAMPVGSWEDFKQKRLDMLAIVGEGLDVAIEEAKP